MLFGAYTTSGVYCYSSPVSSRVGTVTNISDLEVSVKTHWYTPASEAANVKERVLVRRPLVSGVLVGVRTAGSSSFSHCTCGAV